MKRILPAALMTLGWAVVFVIAFVLARTFGGFRWISAVAFFGAIVMSSAPLDPALRSENEPDGWARVFRVLLVLLVVISWLAEYLHLRSLGLDPFGFR